MTGAVEPPRDLRRAFLHGTAWVVAGRWAARLIGLASTAVLARLLSPGDFGLVAIAMLALAFIEVWLALGVETALIRMQHPTREHWDTAWTIRVIQGLVTAALFAGASPFVAAYFREPRVEPLMWLIAAGIVVSGFGNIGVLEFSKELRFDQEFKLRVVGKVLNLVVTLAAAYYLRSYWALAIGIVAGQAIGTALSFVWHPYRPRLTLAKWRDLLGFSLRMVAISIGYFAESKVDEILVGRLGSSRQMGLYSVSSEFGQLPASELAAPLNRSLVPTAAKLQDQPARLRKVYLDIMGSLALIAVPAGIGLALVADAFVRVVLGYQWLEAVPLLQLLAIFGVFRCLYLCPMHLLLPLGYPGTSALFAWASAVLLLGMGLLLLPLYGAIGIAAGRIAVGAIVLLLAVVSVARVTQVTAADQLRRLARPALAAGVMAAAIHALPSDWVHPIVELACKVALGAAVYATAAFALWTAAGRPDGGERLVCDAVKVRLATWRRRAASASEGLP